MLGGASLVMVVEEHGAGKQLVRFRFRPNLSRAALGLLVASGVASLAAPLAGLAAAAITLLAYREIGAAVELGRQAVRTCDPGPD